MLQRSTQVGEFYVMGPPVIPLVKGNDAARNFLVKGIITRTRVCRYSLGCPVQD